MDNSELSRIIDAWIKYGDLSVSKERADRLEAESSYGWARDRLIDTAADQPELVWEFILQLLARHAADEIKGRLAAGPLQDLVDIHCKDLADRIEIEARRNPVFRELLGGLIEIPDDFRQKIQHLLPKPFQP